MKRYIYILLIAQALFFYSCTKQTDTPTVIAEGRQEQADFLNERYVLIAPHVGIQYWQVHKAGLEAAAADFGVEVHYTGVMGDSVEAQIILMEQEILKNPAGILIGPLNRSALVPTINKAIEKGIPVITIDTDSPTSNRLMFIGTDGYAAGVTAADKMASFLGGKGEVGISNVVGFHTCDERARGFTERIDQKYPHIRVVAMVDDKTDPEIATKVNSELLITHPEIDGIFGTNAVSAIGMGAAVKNLNRDGKIYLIGFDTMPPTLNMIAEGVVQATMAQRTFVMSYLGLQMLVSYNRGNFKLVSGWNVNEIQDLGISTLPDRIDTGIIVVDESNYLLFKEKP